MLTCDSQHALLGGTPNRCSLWKSSRCLAKSLADTRSRKLFETSTMLNETKQRGAKEKRSDRVNKKKQRSQLGTPNYLP